MKDNLDRLILENFRIFAGSNTFKLTDLNIYTGANNSGKSTIIKAIKLFSEGLSKSDFPALYLIDEELNLGSYENLINNDSQHKTFKIGFTIKIGTIPNDFKVLYTFYDGKKSDDQFRETALFGNLEVIDANEVVLWGIYMDGGGNRSVIFPSEKGDPGILEYRLNIPLLKKHLPNISDLNFISLLNQFDLIKSSDGYWWGECFNERDYISINHNISTFYFTEFITEMLMDRYFNIASYELKNNLYYKSSAFESEHYQELSENTKYSTFVEYVIRPILISIKAGLDLFRHNNILHIVSDISQERLIICNQKSKYIQQLFRIIDFPDNLTFFSESLALFNIDGLIEIVPHLNSAFEINLITNAQKQLDADKGNKNDYIENWADPILRKQIYLGTYPKSLNNLKGCPKINIADLGKGTANILQLILKIAAILFSYKEEKKKVKIPIIQGGQEELVVKKTILIEEPEAFLHPNWQSRLIDFFLYCLKNYDVQFIIETHSVYLIQRLQFLVAKGEFDHEKATILYFNSNLKEKKFYKVNIRRDGILKESFGTGFYDETANLTADILNAQNQN